MSPGVEGRVEREASTYSSSKKVSEGLAAVSSLVEEDIVVMKG